METKLDADERIFTVKIPLGYAKGIRLWFSSLGVYNAV
jgi:hypothetical protein